MTNESKSAGLKSRSSQRLQNVHKHHFGVYKDCHMNNDFSGNGNFSIAVGSTHVVFIQASVTLVYYKNNFTYFLLQKPFWASYCWKVLPQWIITVQLQYNIKFSQKILLKVPTSQTGLGIIHLLISQPANVELVARHNSCGILSYLISSYTSTLLLLVIVLFVFFDVLSCI